MAQIHAEERKMTFFCSLIPREYLIDRDPEFLLLVTAISTLRLRNLEQTTDIYHDVLFLLPIASNTVTSIVQLGLASVFSSTSLSLKQIRDNLKC